MRHPLRQYRDISLTMSQATRIVPNGSELSRRPGAERIGF